MSLWARFPPSPWSGLWSSSKSSFGGRVVGGGGGYLSYWVLFLSYNCNETENNLNGVIRKDTGHLSGFLSRAMVNSRNIKMMCVWGGGIEVNPPRFFFLNFIKCIFSGILSISTAMNTLLLCLRYIWFEFGEK